MPDLPPFHPTHRLSEWIGCTLEIQCGTCQRVSMPSVLMMIDRRGDQTFADLLPRLRCEVCAVPPGQVWLVAGRHRSCVGGPPNDWAVEIKRMG